MDSKFVYHNTVCVCDEQWTLYQLHPTLNHSWDAHTTGVSKTVYDYTVISVSVPALQVFEIPAFFLPDPVQLPSQSFQPMITEVHHWFPF
jgi:hypothetical protein